MEPVKRLPVPLEARLHPAVASWFVTRFPDGPTEPQRRGWPLVQDGADVLIAAPTGSGKTLAGFLMAIDQTYRAHEHGDDLTGHTSVVYVSPLKALAVDVQQNLEGPLHEIAETAQKIGLPAAPVTVAVRTGDTPPGARTAMLKHPPTILVTTPESLYLYLTASRGRETLSRVATVIVDEVHALARDKRGSHLSLSLERLEHIQTGPRPQRVGLSATQRPIELTSRLLGGAGATRHVEIVDCGHRRDLKVSIELPDQELAAVLSQEQMAEMVQRIANHVRQHRTTLVFVNTRRLAERLAHLLGEALGPGQVAAHHGSLSAERRKRTETSLRAGELRALVATASLELGIDIGPVELTCQIGSPRAISTFLQRVGRSNHSRHGVPEGILFPTTRDELVECAALLGAVRRGCLDAVTMPSAPLDILAQQVIAEVAAAGECCEEELFGLVRQAAPYAELARSDFDAVVELASEGVPTGRGKRMAYLHRDQVNGVLRPRRGARLAALTSGGAIPELGDYRVVAEPDDMFIGSVNEDFAVESMAGDVFLLGTHAWRIRRVTAGEVRVTDAEGARPTIPFWTGEAPSRTAELSEEVSRLRSEVADHLGKAGPASALRYLQETCGLGDVPAEQIVSYLSTGLAQLGAMPAQDDIVFERFFDDAGGMQLVVHSPFGGRVNRALGLALRKRLCVTFDFELQAAASDDAVLLSLGPQHSFPLPSAARLLHPNTVYTTLEQAVLASPMFTSRWRWDLCRSLAILRFRGGKKNPLPVQRMEADDLMAAIFPALAACQENTPPGPVVLPDHVIVRQVLHDCLHEAMDVDGLQDLVSRLQSGAIRAHFVDSVEPSVLSHEIVNGRPYTFLDGAPLEERRARQVQLRRGLPVEARDLSRLDPSALDRVRAEAAPALRSADELHDLLLSTLVHRPNEEWSGWFEQLANTGRAMQVLPTGTAVSGTAVSGTCSFDPEAVGYEPPSPSDCSEAAGYGCLALWCATERRPWVSALFPGSQFRPDHQLPPGPRSPAGARPAPGELSPRASKVPPSPEDEAAPEDPGSDEAIALAVRGHLELTGPVTVEALAKRCCMSSLRVQVGLARLEADGFAMQGSFDPALGAAEQWCARHLLARAHSYTQSRQRGAINPVSAQELMRFLLQWQHVAQGSRMHGRAGLLSVVKQLQGWELAAGAWEEAVLPARVEGYQRRWLDDLCLSGEVGWGRLSLRAPSADGRHRGASVPSRATPVTFMLRTDLPWLLAAKRGTGAPDEPAHGPAREVLDALRSGGATFAADLPRATGRLLIEVQEGLWDLVARGTVTADGFGAVRSLLSRTDARVRRHMPDRHRLSLRPGPASPQLAHHLSEGRWSLMATGAAGTGAAGTGAEVFGRPSPAPLEHDELAEQVASQLLARWGVVFWDLAAHEDLAVPWRDILWALRRFEARGTALGGRFVNGFAGEQYALPEALDLLSHVSRSGHSGELVRICAADPLNLSGVIVAGNRVPALRTNSIVLRDGLMVPSYAGRPGGPGGDDHQPTPSDAAQIGGSGPAARPATP